MTTPVNTPTPWRVDPESSTDIQTADGRLEIATVNSMVLPSWKRPLTMEEIRANAAFIVRAANAHMAFLDLTQALVERGPNATIGESLIESAQHLIAQAEAPHG